MTQPFLTDLKIGDYYVKSTYHEDRKSSMANVYRVKIITCKKRIGAWDVE